MSRTKCSLSGPVSGTAAGRPVYQLAGAAIIQTPLARFSTARTPSTQPRTSVRSPCAMGSSLRLEDDHAARGRPLSQRFEGLVDPLERQARRDHLVEAELPAAVELDVPGHVDAEAVRPHHASEDRLLAE